MLAFWQVYPNCWALVLNHAHNINSELIVVCGEIHGDHTSMTRNPTKYHPDGKKMSPRSSKVD